MKTYRFKVTSKSNQEVLATGSFTSHRELSEKEQLDFYHEFSNGRYLNQQLFVTIEIKEESIAG